ncbi:MAG TPA: Crp/Fnr family transcriptional regulator [Steroidobacteraceae bacterium]|nr:Crp/Fnr family transcriptional regulator [Steroidobacteraceae bacterium]
MCGAIALPSSRRLEIAGIPPGYTARRPRVDWPEPEDNQLLARMIEADRGEILSALEGVALPPGLVLSEAHCPRPYAYFPTSGVVAVSIDLDNGASAEIALKGHESLVGSSIYMGGATSPNRVIVIAAGYAYRIRTAMLAKEFERNPVLKRLMLRFTQALMTQIAQSAACIRHHNLDQRLCRLLLEILDRSPSNKMVITHELIANLLGVRRESITGLAGRLQADGLINRQRGHIAVLDRSKLEQRVCECYAVVKGEYERLLPYDVIQTSVTG